MLPPLAERTSTGWCERPVINGTGNLSQVPFERQAAGEGKRLVRYLEGIGISPAGFDNRGLTSKVLDYFRDRRERGLASLRQLGALIGADIQGAEHIGFEEAKRLLSERFRNRGGAKQAIFRSLFATCSRHLPVTGKGFTGGCIVLVASYTRTEVRTTFASCSKP
jgi:hypothetical protein